MKNILILPTDRPSRLLLSKRGNLQFLKDNSSTNSNNHFIGTYHNIYITSDEEIKEGDWCLCSEELVHKVVEIKSNIGIIRFQDGVTEVLNACKKIILTTDQDLIKDGVQAIDDEFLEWFVNNSKCEFVEIKTKQHFEPNKSKRINPLNGVYYSYKIIIPQEELNAFELPKTHSFCETPEEKCTMNYCDENGCQNRVRHLVDPKQETLEEAAENYAVQYLIEDEQEIDSVNRKQSFKEGAKWQAKRMYSDLDVEIIIRKLMNDFHCGDLCHGDNVIDFKMSPRKWFEQFKNQTP
jgi:hypothetical protein